eukprot:SAG11_NODE_23691_length_384_cov_1.122807_2_plen_36_part_01
MDLGTAGCSVSCRLFLLYEGLFIFVFFFIVNLCLAG